jgi:hypothetical protein
MLAQQADDLRTADRMISFGAGVALVLIVGGAWLIILARRNDRAGPLRPQAGNGPNPATKFRSEEM